LVHPLLLFYPIENNYEAIGFDIKNDSSPETTTGIGAKVALIRR